MKQKTCKTVGFYYGLIFSAFTLVVGALFIWKVLDIYGAGKAVGNDKPFTRENVLAALSQIRLYFWLWVGLVFAGFVLWEVFYVKEAKIKVSPDLQYERLLKSFPKTAPENLSGEYAAVSSFNKLAFSLRCAAWALFGVACIYGVVYLCIPSNFPNKDTTAEVLNLVKNVFPAIFAALLLVCGVGIYEKYTVKKLLPSAQKIVKAQKGEGGSGKLSKLLGVLENRWVILGVRIALGVLAVTLIIIGCTNGDMMHIFGKAIAICSQCIGLA